MENINYNFLREYSEMLVGVKKNINHNILKDDVYDKMFNTFALLYIILKHSLGLSKIEALHIKDYKKFVEDWKLQNYLVRNIYVFNKKPKGGYKLQNFGFEYSGDLETLISIAYDYFEDNIPFIRFKIMAIKDECIYKTIEEMDMDRHELASLLYFE